MSQKVLLIEISELFDAAQDKDNPTLLAARKMT